MGLCLFGAGEALIVRSELGNTPWTVLAEGMALQTPMTIGVATIATGVVVLLLWIPLRQRPGLGTLANALVIGLAVDASLWGLPHVAHLGARTSLLAGGIATVSVGSGLYLGAALGPGPRDGQMTGLHRVTGVPVAPIRVGLELGVMAAGVLLGGTAGIGTAAFALGIGPGVAVALRFLSPLPPAEL